MIHPVEDYYDMCSVVWLGRNDWNGIAWPNEEPDEFSRLRSFRARREVLEEE